MQLAIGGEDESVAQDDLERHCEHQRPPCVDGISGADRHRMNLSVVQPAIFGSFACVVRDGGGRMHLTGT